MLRILAFCILSDGVLGARGMDDYYEEMFVYALEFRGCVRKRSIKEDAYESERSCVHLSFLPSITNHRCQI